MKQSSTLFLKIAIILIGAPVLILSIFAIVLLIQNPIHPDYAHILYPIITGVFLSVIPFLLALYQAFRLLININNNDAFSELSVKGLKNIKFCVVAFSGLYATIMPFIYLLAQLDDAPGIIVIDMGIIFAGLVIAVFAAVLEKLLEEAIRMKLENELTV